MEKRGPMEGTDLLARENSCDAVWALKRLVLTA